MKWHTKHSVIPSQRLSWDVQSYHPHAQYLPIQHHQFDLVPSYAPNGRYHNASTQKLAHSHGRLVLTETNSIIAASGPPRCLIRYSSQAGTKYWPSTQTSHLQRPADIAQMVIVHLEFSSSESFPLFGIINLGGGRKNSHLLQLMLEPNSFKSGQQG